MGDWDERLETVQAVVGAWRDQVDVVMARRRLESPDSAGAIVRVEKDSIVAGWMKSRTFGEYRDRQKARMDSDAYRQGAKAADGVSLDKPSGARKQLAG